MGAKIEKVFGIIVIVIPTMAIIVGVWLVWGQHQRLTQFQPIDATVLGKEVGQRRTSGGDLREYPVVEYEYDVGGERYSSDEVFLFPVNYKGNWARRVIAPFNVGDRLLAFYDPNDPSDAYLLRDTTFAPYAFVLFPMIFVMIGIAILSYGRTRPALHHLQPQSGGDFVMRTQLPLKKGTMFAGAMAGLWCGVGGAAIGHYYLISDPPYSTFAHVGSSIYFAIGLIPVSMFMRRWRLARILADASLYTGTARFAPGETLAVSAEQPVLTACYVSEIQLALVQQIHSWSSGSSKTTHTTTARDLDRQTFAQNRNVMPSNALSVSANFTIPVDAPPTSPVSSTDNSRYDYYFEVVTHIPGQRDYTGRFAFRLESGTVGAQH